MNYEPCESVEMATGTAPRQPKFLTLLEAANGINGVIDHLKELNNILGVSYAEPKSSEPPKPHADPSLVGTLNDLPEELRQAHSLIHDMINTIMNELN